MPLKDPEARRAYQATYSKTHYAANREAYIERAAAAAKVARQAHRDLIAELKSVPCADCGVQYPPYVMQFDHVRGEKLFNIGTAVAQGRSVKTIMTEVAKCDVVCANCHAERTWGPAL